LFSPIDIAAHQRLGGQPVGAEAEAVGMGAGAAERILVHRHAIR
jgi:hypothetical protein